LHPESPLAPSKEGRTKPPITSRQPTQLILTMGSLPYRLPQRRIRCNPTNLKPLRTPPAHLSFHKRKQPHRAFSPAARNLLTPEKSRLSSRNGIRYAAAKVYGRYILSKCPPSAKCTFWALAHPPNAESMLTKVSIRGTWGRYLLHAASARGR
jgi:hypothetical protein